MSHAYRIPRRVTAAFFVLAAVAWLIFAAAVLALMFHRAVRDAVLEPVLRRPVLIFESDDWGFGPPQQAQALTALSRLLSSMRNRDGDCPVMTLGVVLAGPDTKIIRANAATEYARVTLGDGELEPTRDAMLEGRAKGVFALQLHALEHFWPPSLMKAAERSAPVREWLIGDAYPKTEALPAHLQSRWVDASVLPSQPLPASLVADAARLEQQVFDEVFGSPPEVAVPPTFVWTADVERAWADHGIRCVVTPGARYERRTAEGKLDAPAARIRNGEVGDTGVRYVVRNGYFEPLLGHTAAGAWEAFARNTASGRPTLFETHRFNFEASSCESALRELARLLECVLARRPDVAFMSTARLAAAYAEGPALIETRWSARLHCILARLREQSRLYKLARVTGVLLPAWILWRATSGALRTA